MAEEMALTNEMQNLRETRGRPRRKEGVNAREEGHFFDLSHFQSAIWRRRDHYSPTPRRIGRAICLRSREKRNWKRRRTRDRLKSSDPSERLAVP